MTSDQLTALVFIVFVGLLIVGASATLRRSIEYARRGIDQPILLPRDRDMLLGLTVPFGAITAVRLFELRSWVSDAAGDPYWWWILITGLPPIYAIGRYVWFELRVIERQDVDE